MAESRPWRVVALVGNLRPRSRTFQAATTVAAALAGAVGGDLAEPVDLIELGGALFELGSPEVAAALERVLGADALVVASPTYKGSYSGLLKAFLDHIGTAQLDGVLTVPMMIGGVAQHALAVDVHLRAVLVELGASCVTPGLFVLESELEQLPALAEGYVQGVLAHLPKLPG